MILNLRVGLSKYTFIELGLCKDKWIAPSCSVLFTKTLFEHKGVTETYKVILTTVTYYCK